MDDLQFTIINCREENMLRIWYDSLIIEIIKEKRWHYVVMGDTEYSVIDISDTTSSGIGIDY